MTAGKKCIEIFEQIDFVSISIIVKNVNNELSKIL